ncbi:MAG: hypothetical protein DI539_05090 [Flavobacterium psychrophilum]|nr:MAG: hypothetical protein DI539_05090 [Flavobacterium psychrophilum]
MKKKITLLLLLSLNIISAQQDEIDTDRPDQTETPLTVPLNRFQFENGLTHSYEVSEDIRRFELPSTLWKYGVSSKLELRVITTICYEKQPRESQGGLEPVVVGVKYKLWDEQGILPQASVIGQVLLPDLSAKSMKTDYPGPELRFLFRNTISQEIDLGYNTSIEWDGEHTRALYDYTFSPSVRLANMLKAFVESYGFLKVGRHSEHWVDGGLMFLITKDIQLDVSGGYEITTRHDHRHSTFESIGFSFRI